MARADTSGVPVEEPFDDRLIAFERWWNVRELGGVALADGRYTNYGVAWRAASPQWCSAKDLITAKVAGVSHLVDLRSTGADTAAISYVNVLAGIERDNSWPAVRMLREIALQGGNNLARAAHEVIAASARGIAVFHCNTGKDRTGLLAMLLLGAGGVGRGELIADFMASQPHVNSLKTSLEQEGYPLWTTHTPDYVRLPLDAQAGEAALDVFDESGGCSSYLLAHGLGASEIESWRTRLTA